MSNLNVEISLKLPRSGFKDSKVFKILKLREKNSLRVVTRQRCSGIFGDPTNLSSSFLLAHLIRWSNSDSPMIWFRFSGGRCSKRTPWQVCLRWIQAIMIACKPIAVDASSGRVLKSPRLKSVSWNWKMTCGYVVWVNKFKQIDLNSTRLCPVVGLASKPGLYLWRKSFDSLAKASRSLLGFRLEIWISDELSRAGSNGDHLSSALNTEDRIGYSLAINPDNFSNCFSLAYPTFLENGRRLGRQLWTQKRDHLEALTFSRKSA